MAVGLDDACVVTLVIFMCLCVCVIDNRYSRVLMLIIRSLITHLLSVCI